jgi:Cellulose biosynthesis protein BcsN
MREMRGPPLRITAPAFILTAALLMGGCAGQRTIVGNWGGAQALAPDQAFVSLGPGSPAVLSVIETDYANATRQRIVLASRGRTPGENQLRVDVFGVKNDNVGPDTSLPDLPPAEAELSAEAQETLPGVPLRMSLNYLQNRYGPFGYLVGKTAQGDTCIYAWQRLATPDWKLSPINSRNAISIRLRLCDPSVSEAALAATMMNLSVNVALSSGSWTGEPNELSANIGAVGAPIAPPSIAVAAANPFPPSSPPAVRRYRVKRAPPRERAPPATSFVQPSTPAGVIVPPPPLAPLNAQPAAAAPPAGADASPPQEPRP